jgi:hypothetical protein
MTGTAAARSASLRIRIIVILRLSKLAQRSRYRTRTSSPRPYSRARSSSLRASVLSVPIRPARPRLTRKVPSSPFPIRAKARGATLESRRAGCRSKRTRHRPADLRVSRASRLKSPPATRRTTRFVTRYPSWFLTRARSARGRSLQHRSRVKARGPRRVYGRGPELAHERM